MNTIDYEKRLDGIETRVRAAQLSWSHNTVPLDKLKDSGSREWYAHRTLTNCDL